MYLLFIRDDIHRFYHQDIHERLSMSTKYKSFTEGLFSVMPTVNRVIIYGLTIIYFSLEALTTMTDDMKTEELYVYNPCIAF
jgi:hypothetical protein